MTSYPMSVSKTFRHDKALAIWYCLRLGDNLERAERDSTDGDKDNNMDRVNAYLAEAFAQMSLLLPGNADWSRYVHNWHMEAKDVWHMWWDVFNLTGGVDICPEESSAKRRKSDVSSDSQ